MIQINDLHIEEEILPLFDFTRNAFAKERLTKLFQWPRFTLADIQSRQEIFQAFVEQVSGLKNFSYSRSEFAEVYHFLTKEAELLTLGNIDVRVPFYDSKKYQQCRGRVLQTLSLMSSLYDQLNLQLQPKIFPHQYKADLEIIVSFLSRFEKYRNASHEYGFNATKRSVGEFCRIILELRDKQIVETFFETFFQFEAYLSVAIGHVRMGFSFPVVGSNQLSLIQFFHPLLKSPGRNDFKAHANLALLSGPNMSGKSTLLKSLSLCVYLAHIGMSIPAHHGTIPYFDSISIAIDLKDDLINGFSHFMTEVKNVKNVALAASEGKRCFAVFDELFRGTNIEDALGLIQQTISGFNQFDGLFFIISTHLPHLQHHSLVENREVVTYYLDCEILENVPKFNFQLKQGWSDVKVGRLLFENEGIPQLFRHL